MSSIVAKSLPLYDLAVVTVAVQQHFQKPGGNCRTSFWWLGILEIQL